MVLGLDATHDESSIAAFDGHGEIEFIDLGAIIQIGDGKAGLVGIEML